MPSNKKVEKLYEDSKLKPHSVFCLGEKPFILFYENPSDKQAIYRAVWNLNEVPIVIIAEHNTINIYNGFSYLKNETSLSHICSDDQLNDFEYFKLVTGETWEKYQKELSYKNRVDYKLMESIKDARIILINDHGLNDHTANALLGKTIFTRYLIDRKVRIGFNSQPKEWTTSDFCQVLQSRNATQSFFNYLQEQFNGDLFPFEDSSSSISQNALNVIIDLLNGVQLKTGQLSLFDIFDFSIIPVEFISNVYELFIGHEEQAKTGAYYTPLFLVEYIASQTVHAYFKTNPKTYRCKVLDPACGSGIFLVETLRGIIEKFNELHPGISKGSKKYRESIKKLAKENIFGIDKDKSAVSIAVFSVYLTLLDYQSPRDIENFKFPALMDSNFYTTDFFDTDHAFNEHFRKVKFDFIIGNPPWKRGSGSGKRQQLYEQYIKSRKTNEGKKDNPITISNKEIAQAFLLRSSDFSSDHTIVSFIITSKILYNLNAHAFRRYFLNHYFIDKVFELSPVRKEVFDKSNDPSVAPPAVIFFRYANNSKTSTNEMLHLSVKPNRFFSLFKIFLIQRNDVKKVKQDLLMKYDWSWKVLLYGNFLDFYFIKRLKESHETIAQSIKAKDCLIGQGIMIHGNRELQDATHLIGKQYIRTSDDIHPFSLNVDPKMIWNIPKALYPRNPNLYKAPLLLITGGISNEFKATSAISYKKDIVFKSSLTGIRCTDIKFLENVCGYLYSKLFSYYLLSTGSSAGVEREEAHDKEKFSFPYTESSTISAVVKKLHDSKKNLRKNSQKLFSPQDYFSTEIQKLEKELDITTIKAFNLNDVEKSLVDYGVNYVIPTVMNAKSSGKLSDTLKFQDKFLQSYIDAFYSRFDNFFQKQKKGFSIDVWYSPQIIGIFFNVISSQNKSEKVNWIQKSDDDLIKKVIVLGHEKITEKLFIQKDIRGFEKSSFYIFKPNEKMVWHKALAYLDLNYFVDAILKAGNEI